MAERVGFEPTERFPVHSISSAANSTTLAPLRKARMKDEGGRMKDLLRPFRYFFSFSFARLTTVTRILVSSTASIRSEANRLAVISPDFSINSSQ